MLEKLSIGIIGTRGIGKVYVRELAALGAKKLYILGKKYKNSIKSKKDIESEVNVEIIICKTIEDLKLKKLDLVCICSPTITHLNHIKMFSKNKTKIIVEKPLFWDDSLSPKKIINILESLFSKSLNKITTNLPLISYAKSLEKNFSIKKKKIKKVYFKYYTSGNNNYKNIGVDLLPHALSFLLSFFNVKLDNIFVKSIKVLPNSWKCLFYYNDIMCIFDFDQNINRKKTILNISINNLSYLRKQNYDKTKFKKNDVFIGRKNLIKKIKNPMSDSIKTNVQKLLKNNINSKDVDIQKAIIKLMILFLK